MVQVANDGHIAHELWVGHERGHELVGETGLERLTLKGLNFLGLDGGHDGHLQGLRILLHHLHHTKHASAQLNLGLSLRKKR
eukprot:1160744-Pelagomonas_calceolata.AAC.4